MVKVKFADVVFGIDIIDEDITSFLNDYITDENVDVIINISDKDIDEEKNIFFKQEGIFNLPNSQFKKLALQRKVANELYKYNAILFHGSALAIKDNAYLFAGHSGAGKSTHASIYRRVFDDVIMINDDKPFIRIFDDEVRIYGSPWDGKHHLSKNLSFPLKSIAYINQAKDNHIEKINNDKAIIDLYTQTYKPASKEGLKKTLELVALLMKRVNVYNMYCNLEDEAAIISYKALSNE